MGYVRLGGEMLVNTLAAIGQLRSAITRLAGGGFVVTWEDTNGQTGDASSYGVKAQVFDATGTKIGTQFLVNSTTAGDQLEPSISALASGGFVVAWIDASGEGGDSSGYGIKAQRFDAAGAEVGVEILVNTVIAGSQVTPAVAALGNGFVVTWRDHSGQGGDASESGIKAQIFDAAGAKVGSEFLVNTATASFQEDPAVTALAFGGFVVTWTDSSGQGDEIGIKAQMFSAAGAKIGGELLVNSVIASMQFEPAVTSLSNGGFVVSWSSFSVEGDDTSEIAVKAQIFDEFGAKVGGELLINTTTSGRQEDSAITALGDGFLVTWQDDSGEGDDASGAGVKAQVFDAEGNRIGVEFQVNAVTDGNQILPTVVALSGGRFAVSWGSGGDIKAQIFAPETIDGTNGIDFLHGTLADETLNGLEGNDVIDGGGGADTMVGGIDNDIYIVDSFDDVVVERDNAGFENFLEGPADEVQTDLGTASRFGVLYQLPNHVEKLTGTAAGAQGVFANALDNVITMGGGNDLVVLHDGGADTVSSGGGNDFLYYGSTLGAGDGNDGGAGNDTIGLLGTYSLILGADALVNIERLAVYSGGSAPDAFPSYYDIMTVDANVAAGRQLIVIARSLLAHELFRFDGSAESDGSFNIRAGRGNDIIVGGAGNDRIWGHLGGDLMTGGAGNDLYDYMNVADSSGEVIDHILDFAAGDRINLIAIDADGNAANGNGSFAWIGANAFSGVAGQIRVTGSGNDWLVEADVNGDSVADLAIEVTTAGGHALGAGDFYF